MLYMCAKKKLISVFQSQLHKPAYFKIKASKYYQRFFQRTKKKKTKIIKIYSETLIILKQTRKFRNAMNHLSNPAL